MKCTCQNYVSFVSTMTVANITMRFIICVIPTFVMAVQNAKFVERMKYGKEKIVIKSWTLTRISSECELGLSKYCDLYKHNHVQSQSMRDLEIVDSVSVMPSDRYY